MNVKQARRLAAVKDRIREEPRRFDMDYWAEPSDEAPCGTAACIAGHVVWRSLGSPDKLLACKQEKGGDYIMERARQLLGLEIKDAFELFYQDEWSDELRSQYDFFDNPWGAENARKRAEVACEAIDDFLERRGFGPDGERAKEAG